MNFRVPYKGVDWGGEGRGHCLFVGRYPLSNYCPCFSEHSTTVFSLSLTATYFGELQTTTL